MKLVTELENRFGFTSFRPGQREVIEDCLRRRNVFAMLPTGSGKSICYLLSGYMMEGIVVIVSPLLSLMEDQVQRLRMNGEKRVAALNSFLDYQQREYVLNHLRHYKFLFISPEMLRSERIKRVLAEVNVALFVVDEAHCISQWGYEFRPDYLKLANIRDAIGSPPCLALTATADQKIRQDIVTHLRMKDCSFHLYGIDRPNIALSVETFDTTVEKDERLVSLVNQLNGPGIIYFSSREMAETLCQTLSAATSLRVSYYHGGLTTEDRLLIQNQFLHDQLDVICCTNAFGMGIDKNNIRYCLHYHYPSHMNSYLQEIGRAGRDSLPSIAITLVADGDDRLPQALIDREFPEPHIVSNVIMAANGQEEMDIEKKALEEGASETGARFLKEFLAGVDQELPVETKVNQILLNIDERKKVKMKELAVMREWLASGSCRRAVVLARYDEKHIEENSACCDRCGLSYESYISNHPIEQQASTLLSWKKRLEQLLPIGGVTP